MPRCAEKTYRKINQSGAASFPRNGEDVYTKTGRLWIKPITVVRSGAPTYPASYPRPIFLAYLRGADAKTAIRDLQAVDGVWGQQEEVFSDDARGA